MTDKYRRIDHKTRRWWICDEKPAQWELM